MKKLFFLLAFSVMAMTGFSQLALVGSNSKTIDTVVNGALKTLTAPPFKYYSKTLAASFTATKISGTVGGTATLQGSLDNANWFVASATTYTLTDVASQTFGWSVVDPGPLYFRVVVAGTGTMSAAVTGKMFTRKP